MAVLKPAFRSTPAPRRNPSLRGLVTLWLRLKLIADAGLLGLLRQIHVFGLSMRVPNCGLSFHLYPNLGVVGIDNSNLL